MIIVLVLLGFLTACGGAFSPPAASPGGATAPAAVTGPPGFRQYADSYVRLAYPPDFEPQAPATNDVEVNTRLFGPAGADDLRPQILVSTRTVASDNAVDADLEWQVFRVRHATLVDRRTVNVSGNAGPSVQLTMTYPQTLSDGSTLQVRVIALFMQAPRRRGVTVTLVAPEPDFGRLGLSDVIPTVAVAL